MKIFLWPWQAGHPTVWHKARQIANHFTADFFGPDLYYTFRRIKGGDISTDDPSRFVSMLAYVAATPFLVDDLERHYGVGPAADVGVAQTLHACRRWSGGEEEQDELCRIDSAYETCAALRNAIVGAVEQALESWHVDPPVDLGLLGRGGTGWGWVGHGMHMIEDSFSPGHTKRDSDSMDLVDMCTSSRPYPHHEESNLCRLRVPAHSDGGADDLMSGGDLKPVAQAAVYADVGYLLLVYDLISAIPFHTDGELQKAKQRARERLEAYFDNDSFVPIPDLPDGLEPSADGRYRISGYFRLDRLGQEVPIHLAKFAMQSERRWTTHVPFYVNGRRDLLAYNRDTGAFGLYATAPRETEPGIGGTLESYLIREGDLGPQWDYLVPLAGAGATAWILAYRGTTGEMAMFRVCDQPAYVDRIPFAQTCRPRGLTSLISIHDADCGIHAFGYQAPTGTAILGRVDVRDPSRPTFSAKYLEGIDAHYTYVQSLATLQPPRTCLIFYDAKSGGVRIERLDLSGLSAETTQASAVMTRVADRVWDSGWTSMIPFTAERWVRRELGVHTYVLLYRPVRSVTQMRLVRLQFSEAGELEDAPIIREAVVVPKVVLGMPGGAQLFLQESRLVPFCPTESAQDFMYLSPLGMLMYSWRNEVEAAAPPFPPYFYPFIGNKNTGEVHHEECRWVRKINPENRLTYCSVEEAIADGLDGCHYCLDEYDTR